LLISENTGGFLQNIQGRLGLTWLTRLTRPRSVGPRSSGCCCSRVKRCGGIRSGASDLDPAARNVCKRLAAGQSRRRAAAAALGGEVRQRTLTRALVPGLKRGELLRAARGAAKPTGTAVAAVAVEKRRRGRATRRRDSAKAAKSGDDFQALQLARMATSDVGGFFTSRRRTWTASRRRDSGGGGESTAAAAAAAHGNSVTRARVRRILGAARP
jgi:hypothetical protein